MTADKVSAKTLTIYAAARQAWPSDYFRISIHLSGVCRPVGNLRHVVALIPEYSYSFSLFLLLTLLVFVHPFTHETPSNASRSLHKLYANFARNGLLNKSYALKRRRRRTEEMKKTFCQFLIITVPRVRFLLSQIKLRPSSPLSFRFPLWTQRYCTFFGFFWRNNTNESARPV